jgi:hypothetical protein
MIAEDMCTQAGDQEEDAPYVLNIQSCALRQGLSCSAFPVYASLQIRIDRQYKSNPHGTTG